jgi:tetratricopeptide (TPR) repeat protein
VTPERINELFWEPLFDWQNKGQDNMHTGAPVTNSEVMFLVFNAALQRNGEQVAETGQKYRDACMQRPSCQILYARAAFNLNREDIVRDLAINNITWRALSGKGTPQVQNEDQLTSYQQYYQRLLVLFPGKPDIYQKLGSMNRSVGHWNEALTYFEQAYNLAPDIPQYRCNFGEALVYTGKNPELGLELCQEAVRQSPGDIWLYEKAGRLNAVNGNCEKALEFFQEAVRLFPERSEPQQWLRYLKSGGYNQCD